MLRRSLPSALLALVAAALTLGPAPASAQQPPLAAEADAPRPPILTTWDLREPPSGYHHEKRLRLGLLITGAAVFGTPWAITAGASAYGSITGYGSSEAVVGIIPVVGPFLLAYQALNAPPTPPGFDNNGSAPLIVPFLIADGIMQTAGAAMIIAGALGKDVMVRNDSLALLPVPLTFGKGSAGLGLAGAF